MRILITLLTLLGCVLGLRADEVHEVYMLRLDDEIGSTTWRHTREAVADAERDKASLLLVHLNTYGGSVVHADSIRTALMRVNMPVVAFVDNNAASAGALIALACDSVYMRSGSSMGAVTVVVHLIFELFAGEKIATVAALFSAVFVYGATLVLLGGVTEDEIRNMPKGRAILSLCRRLHLFRE